MYKIIKILTQLIYLTIYDINYYLKSFSKKKNFILLTPRILSLLIKKVFILDKKNYSFFIQNIRNKYDLLTIHEIFQEEFYNLSNFDHCKFIEKYYLEIFKVKKKPLIIDCGANIGASSIYFRKIFKEAFIVSIEPEISNFFSLKKNFSDIDSELINKAISYDGKNYSLKYSKDPRGFQINNGNILNEVQTITVINILDKYNNKLFSPFIIKIDIEGFEDNLFTDNYSWINNFKIIIIEIHDWLTPGKSNSKNFLKALNEMSKNENSRDLIISGDNLISIKNE